jgi:hypothetical protein
VLAPHSTLPGEQVIELWHDGQCVGTVAGADGPGQGGLAARRMEQTRQTMKHSCSVTLTLILNGALHGAPVLDQQCLGSEMATPKFPTGGSGREVPYKGTPPNGTTIGDLAQTFTVGISGRLTRVDLLIDNAWSPGGINPVTVLITRTNNGIPIPQVLVVRQLLVPFSKGYVWYTVTGFSLPVLAGEVFAIRIHTDKYGILWRAAGNIGYARGQGYSIILGTPRIDADFGFRT